jgi:hypothetical protein
VRAREWAIAGAFRTPADYDIPAVPDWQVCRPDCGGIAFATDDGPFIAAEHPIPVRR